MELGLSEKKKEKSKNQLGFYFLILFWLSAVIDFFFRGLTFLFINAYYIQNLYI